MTWPTPGRASVSLPAAAPFRSSYTGPLSGALNSVTSRAGSLPVWVSGPAANTDVAVSVATHRAALAAGVKGVVMDLAARSAGTVSVRLDYSAFSGAYGGDWASRLRLVEMPACALTTPARASCRRQTLVPGVNDTASQSLSANVKLGSASVILATTATTGGAEGDYHATSLNSSGTWAVQQGDFTYSYPIEVPPALGGTTPSVVLGYDSQSIDGETSGTNTQASWIGDGWDYSPGFIERSYQPCSQDGISGSGDQCWGGYNATLALPGHSSVLIRDDANGTWHLRNDDGSSVQELHGASNGLWNGEYWLVTTPDGTKYYFGLNHMPGGNGSDAATNSAWGVPVYNPNSGDPCYDSSDGSSSQCQMGYRWNLDYVVDPHNNLTVYDYAAETNYYERGGNTLTEYVRGGYPTSISYGYQLSDAIAGAQAPAQVTFNTSQRCLTTATFTDCSYGNLSSSTASHWPDTPYDLNCGSSGSCSTTSPTFWSTVRLTSITTQVLKGSGYQQVDSYALTQSFPNASGASQPVMFLDSIQRTGEDGSPVSLPPVTFTPTEIDNRVDGLVPAAEALYRPRISTIATAYGSDLGVTYAAPACSRVNNTMPSAADTNTMPCFPVYWTPAGEVSPILDWFNKTLVSAVSTADETKAGSPVQVTSYQYVGGAAWHQDEAPISDPDNRTWDQYRGYAKVIVTTGASPDPVTQTETTYMRGMDGDPRSGGGTSSATVADSLGDSITDSDWLAGQVLETDTYTAAGGTVDAKTINGPWTFTSTASQAMPDGLTAMTAEMTSSEQTRSLALLASGSWRTTTTDTRYNSSAQPVQVDAKGDGSSSDPEVCTTTAYASSSSNPMMNTYASEVTAIAGPCGTNPTAGNTVSDTRTFYDNSTTLGDIPGAGDVTSSQVITGYDASGNPQFMTESSATYDTYGRALTTTDAKGYSTQTTYTPATGALPTQTVATNPMGWKTTTTYDPARGLPLTVTDANGRVTTEAYDALGRVTAVWLPGRSTSLSANDTFSYNVSDTAPTYVTTQTLREDGTYATSIKIYDGLLQLREVQETPGNGAAGRLISDTFYDSHGWVVKNSSPYYDQTTSPNGVLSPADDHSVPSQTVTQYDGQGRVVASQFYSLGTRQWQTSTSYPGMDERSVDPPAGGTATTTFTNALGETSAQWSYSGSATATGNQSDAVDTSYTYTPSGQVASISDNAGNKWTYAYNLLGEKVSQTDPDSGTTTFGYDQNGNLTSTTDARQQVLSYTYDQLDRKTAEYSGSPATGTELASWAYDSLAKGQDTSTTAYINGSAYTEAITGYNTAYQPTGTSLTIPAAEGKLQGTYTTGSTYSPITGELASTTYSGDGGLPSETVHYSYDEEGLLSMYRGQTSYLDSVIYSPFGQVLRTTTGPYGAQLVATSSYDAGTGHALQTTDNVQVGSAAVDTTNYTYAESGNLTSVSDAQAGGSTDTQCFNYNHLNQLTAAWSDTGGTSTAPAPSVSGIGGCTTTTPTASNIGGPAPYWETWTYDPLGDRSSQTSHSPSGTVTQTLSYPGGNGTSAASQANSVSSVTTATSSGSASTAYTYNATGDTMSETSSTGATETFGYTPQDQVRTATTSSGTSTYLYDADGNLLLQKDPGSTSLYLDNGAEELTLNTSANTVSGTRYYTEPDGTTIVRSSSGAINYELANQQGTNLEIVNATTDAVTRRYYDPYGNQRGTAATGWVDNRAFLNQPTDSATGLDLLGTRQYDPLTGRFLQVDSLLEPGDSRQMGGYAYAADDPVNGSDPTGNDCWGPGGEDIPCGGGSGSSGGSGGGGGSSAGGSGGSGGCWGPGGEWLCGDSGGSGSGSGDGGSSGCWGPGGEYLCGSYNGNNGGQCWGPGGEWTCGNQPSAGDGGGLQWSGHHWIPWNPPKPTPVATRPANSYTCARFGTGCNPVPVSSSGGGGGGGLFSFLRKAAHFVGQVTGVNQIINCVTTWTASSCAQAALAVGMDVLTVATDGGASAVEVAMDGSVDLSSEVASEGVDLAAEAGGDGIDGAATQSGDGALTCSVNSFTGQTRVLLANGAKTPIDKVVVGEKVLATDPYTGVTQPRPVTDLIVHSGQHAMVTFTLAGGARLTATRHHLFWDASTGKFAYASSLRAGTRLLEGNGHQVRVIGARDFTADLTAYNLAVDGLHTYYVEAGDTSVLVHNGCGVEPAGGSELEPAGESTPDYTHLPETPGPETWQARTGSPRLPPPVYWSKESLGGPKWKQALFLLQRLWHQIGT